MSNSKKNGWVGVDLDGTLAVYDGWQGIEHIGAPIPATVRRVKSLLRAGVEVRIFTARVQEGEAAIRAIESWCLKHLGVVLPITDKKDFGMVYALDDRAVTVEFNTGRPLVLVPPLTTIRRHWKVGAPNPEEFRH